MTLSRRIGPAAPDRRSTHDINAGWICAINLRTSFLLFPQLPSFTTSITINMSSPEITKWDANKNYTAGNKVTYDGSIYEAVKTHVATVYIHFIVRFISITDCLIEERPSPSQRYWELEVVSSKFLPSCLYCSLKLEREQWLII